MKKVLVSLLVLALATAGVFAAVNVNGEIVAGYTFNYANDTWNNDVFGQDNYGSQAFKLNANISDDEGIWSGNLKGVMNADSRLDGKFTVDFGKVFMGADSDVSIKLDVAANNRIAGLNAYNNASGLNLSRIRTNNDNLWFGLTVGYTDLVQVQIAGGPNTIAKADANYAGEGDLLASVLVKPLDGLAVSAGYVMNGEGKVLYDVGQTGKGALNAAVDVNVGTLAGLDFDLGVSAAYKYGFGSEVNGIYATVYGGMDVVDVAVEYAAMIPAQGATAHALYAGVDLNVVENLLLNVYGGATDIATEDTFYVGGNVGYTISGITLNANIQYTGANTATGCFGDIGEGAVKAKGFSITPSIALAF